MTEGQIDERRGRVLNKARTNPLFCLALKMSLLRRSEDLLWFTPIILRHGVFQPVICIYRQEWSAWPAKLVHATAENGPAFRRG